MVQSLPSMSQTLPSVNTVSVKLPIFQACDGNEEKERQAGCNEALGSIKRNIFQTIKNGGFCHSSSLHRQNIGIRSIGGMADQFSQENTTMRKEAAALDEQISSLSDGLIPRFTLQQTSTLISQSYPTAVEDETKHGQRTELQKEATSLTNRMALLAVESEALNQSPRQDPHSDPFKKAFVAYQETDLTIHVARDHEKISRVNAVLIQDLDSGLPFSFINRAHAAKPPEQQIDTGTSQEVGSTRQVYPSGVGAVGGGLVGLGVSTVKGLAEYNSAKLAALRAGNGAAQAVREAGNVLQRAHGAYQATDKVINVVKKSGLTPEATARILNRSELVRDAYAIAVDTAEAYAVAQKSAAVGANSVLVATTRKVGARVAVGTVVGAVAGAVVGAIADVATLGLYSSPAY